MYLHSSCLCSALLLTLWSCVDGARKNHMPTPGEFAALHGLFRCSGSLPCLTGARNPFSPSEQHLPLCLVLFLRYCRQNFFVSVITEKSLPISYFNNVKPFIINKDRTSVLYTVGSNTLWCQTFGLFVGSITWIYTLL